MVRNIKHRGEGPSIIEDRHLANKRIFIEYLSRRTTALRAFDNSKSRSWWTSLALFISVIALKQHSCMHVERDVSAELFSYSRYCDVLPLNCSGQWSCVTSSPRSSVAQSVSLSPSPISSPDEQMFLNQWEVDVAVQFDMRACDTRGNWKRPPPALDPEFFDCSLCVCSLILVNASALSALASLDWCHDHRCCQEPSCMEAAAAESEDGDVNDYKRGKS